MIEGIGAVTLATHDMPRAVRFYRALGFEVVHGGEASPFTSLRAGGGHLNLACRPAQQRWRRWGRVIFHVADVDALHERALAAGCRPTTTPRDAEWGERFFHLQIRTATTSASRGPCGLPCEPSPHDGFGEVLVHKSRPWLRRSPGREYGVSSPASWMIDALQGR
jgi:catechol 2,3-dioxygenase-like lactoylglutathione lyase family enzyme